MRAVNPHVSVDCVVFGFDFEQLKILLIQRDTSINNDKSVLSWALPGDLISDDEDLGQAAHRVLKELTNIEHIYLKQFKAFGDPSRIKKPSDRIWLKKMRTYPEARVITVAYFALVNINDFSPLASKFAIDVKWHPITELPELAFDHETIIEEGHQALRRAIEVEPIAFKLLPEKFTLSQVQKLYEHILGEELDKRNFRKKVLAMDVLKPLDEKQKGVSHKPAQLFELK